jgi:hypothetical protein
MLWIQLGLLFPVFLSKRLVMIRNYRLSSSTVTFAAFFCIVGLSDQSMSADQVSPACGGAILTGSNAIASLTVTNTKNINTIKPSIAVTRRSKPATQKGDSTVTVVAIGPQLTAKDSFAETNNSTVLTCTSKGFDMVTTITRDAAALNRRFDRRKTSWRPRFEATFEHPKDRPIIINSTWKMVSSADVEIDRDLANPRQIFPISVRKVIR